MLVAIKLVIGCKPHWGDILKQRDCKKIHNVRQLAELTEIISTNISPRMGLREQV
jgi:hypothetical protein